MSGINTLFIAQHLIELDEIDSTNSYAQRLISESNPVEGTAILAYKQIQGKGQRGAAWESEEGKNITFSIILHPRFLDAESGFKLNQAIALGIYDYVKNELGNDVKIKWPNDIYYKNQKLAGVLIENGLRGKMISHSVVGVGLNINQEIFTSITTAISFKNITGKNYPLSDCFASVCKYIEVRYLQLKADLKGQDKEYTQALYALNEVRSYKDATSLFKGIIIAVTNDGKLVVEKETGEKMSYSFKEITLINEP